MRNGCEPKSDVYWLLWTYSKLSDKISIFASKQLDYLFMKKLILSTVLFFLSISIFSQDYKSYSLSEEQTEQVLETVNAWVDELFEAKDIDRLIQLSDIPFALDREKVLSDKNELREVYLKIFDNKGKRDVPKFDSEILEHKFEIFEECIPLNFVKVLVSIKDEDNDRKKAILICVSIKGEEYRIVGFSD